MPIDHQRIEARLVALRYGPENRAGVLYFISLHGTAECCPFLKGADRPKIEELLPRHPAWDDPRWDDYVWLAEEPGPEPALLELFHGAPCE